MNLSFLSKLAVGPMKSLLLFIVGFATGSIIYWIFNYGIESAAIEVGELDTVLDSSSNNIHLGMCLCLGWVWVQCMCVGVCV